MSHERGAPIAEIELRAKGEGDDARAILSGYAARFNSRSSPIGQYFVETIERDAFASTDMTDVPALFDHDSSKILGRTTAGSLRLTVDEQGLRYEVDLDLLDPDAISAQRKLATKKVTGSSFAFTVGDDNWEQGDDGLWLRTIKRIDRLYDVGPVTYPAYPAASAALRSLKERDPLATMTAEERSAHAASLVAANADARKRSLGLIG